MALNTKWEVRKINTELLSVSQIISLNPIIRERIATKQKYFDYLNSYIKAGKWERRKYVKAELRAYRDIILDSEIEAEEHDITYYRYFLILDVIHILGYGIETIKPDHINSFKIKYLSDFLGAADKKILDRVIDAFQNTDDLRKVRSLLRFGRLKNESDYIKRIIENVTFMKTSPISIMVTATMSAGKSTFINALTGKYICLSQNMACTSKNHMIVNKVVEDGFTYEYDHDLELMAGRKELLNDNTDNVSDKIVVGTHFNGKLGDQRIVICDSPGVNSSENFKHALVADRLIKKHKYDLLIYIINATQMGTNDEDNHLNYIKRIIGKTPILFVVNKIDNFDVDEEDYERAIERTKLYLMKKGFSDPIVCPVSSRAGYLSKRFVVGEISRTEKRELYNYIDKFSLMGIPSYYEKNYKRIRIEDVEHEEEQLLKQSGFAYVEELIVELVRRNRNGSGLCKV